jgi:hypothetical protein
MEYDYEKLGAFYLGRHYDLKRRELEKTLLLYDSKDLVTHAVCVGMTGSGKTGLCITLLEEAAIDGIPSIVIDPKGDLGNLLLTFPDLQPADFRPWINEDDARRREMTADEFAAGQADLWRTGLESFGQGGERIRRLRDSAEFIIYTPGSEAGQSVSILSSFAAPSAEVMSEADLLRDRINSTATSLLGLLGIDVDPIQSREHILLSNLLDKLWRSGEKVDLGSIIRAIQNPPIERVGVMELDSFFPSADRFKFAMQVNNLLAAPGFQGWMAGQPLDVGEILYTPEGKPRVSIFSIAHLSDPERMFFVSLLLNQTLSWMRSRPGTTSLRALLYMDEIFGYMPPVAEPPSKRPLLTLLKQARAFGVGLVVATQNPVDLDYKGLSNTGTWFIGRLQTERDKQKILDGLEGVDAGEEGFDRKSMDEGISGLGKRVFLLHNVHERAPVVFHTRWAMSYLRGPLTRQQIKGLMEGRKLAETPIASAPPAEAAPPPSPREESAAMESPAVSSRPILPPGVPQYFVGDGRHGALHSPGLLGLAAVHYVDRRTKKEIHREEIALTVPLAEGLIDLDWEDAAEIEVEERQLSEKAPPRASFGEVPDSAAKASSYTKWRKELSDHLYRSKGLDLFRSPTFELTSEPLESERDFRIRLREVAHERRDEEKEKLRSKYASKIQKLEEKIRKARQTLEKEKEQARGQRLQTAISVGATILAAVTGRKRLSYSTLSRATTAARSMGRSGKERQDIDRAEENIEALTRHVETLGHELEEQLSKVEDQFDPLTEQLEVTSVRPRRSDVDVKLVALAWIPGYRSTQ